MKIVLGLGNPGREYEATRHNVGWRVVDRVAGSLEGAGEFRPKRKFGGFIAEGTARGPAGQERVLLVKPETYMNLSGECGRAVADYYGVEAESLLVVADDVNLPLARLRFRRGGSSGGHNGLESIIRHLGTEAFPRLRVGVGRPAGAEEEGLTGHVLGGFSREEAPLARRAEERAAEAVGEWIGSGIEPCMDRYNGPSEGEEEES